MKTIIAFLANLIFFSGCAADTSQMINKQDDAIAIVDRYVFAQKGWHRNQYRIEIGKRKALVTMYVVVYLEDERKAVPGGGESFEVVYDRARKRVVRELGLQ
jgi:hypothetical protein